MYFLLGDEMKYFEHRSRPSIREIFLTIGETVREKIVKSTLEAESFGVLADEVADVSVMEQLVVFIKFYDSEQNCAITKFLGVKSIPVPTAEVITKNLLALLEECNLTVNNLTSFVSDEAAVMISINGLLLTLIANNPKTQWFSLLIGRKGAEVRTSVKSDG